MPPLSTHASDGPPRTQLTESPPYQCVRPEGQRVVAFLAREY
ncbi:hypothetical protein [Streptomyces caniscabiei]